jgi:hypothetical protein
MKLALTFLVLSLLSFTSFAQTETPAPAPAAANEQMQTAPAEKPAKASRAHKSHKKAKKHHKKARKHRKM